MAKKSTDKKRINENKPAWQIILDLMVAQDTILLYRICRKMIIHLNRTEVPEINEIIENLNPGKPGRENSQRIGENWPKPKGTPFIARDLYKRILNVADEYLDDEEITALISRWIQQENLNFLSFLLEQGEASLVKVAEGVNRYIKLFNPDLIQSFDEIIGLRVSLINRFLSDNLDYVRIAKKHITIKEIANIIDRMIGPAGGYGKLGGKSAGLSLAKKILTQKRKDNPILENVSTPKTRFLSSDSLLQFLNYNALE
ncbi:MAG: hypothetical protein PF588_01555, partial [Candidatus Kapabacteria bacterium]|nr:hypothetical protein [Candidatus Kapabacteria bacterium]